MFYIYTVPSNLFVWFDVTIDFVTELLTEFEANSAYFEDFKVHYYGVLSHK